MYPKCARACEFAGLAGAAIPIDAVSTLLSTDLRLFLLILFPTIDLLALFALSLGIKYLLSVDMVLRVVVVIVVVICLCRYYSSIKCSFRNICIRAVSTIS